jgi:hypothetical protein
MEVFACLLKRARNVAVFVAALVVLSAFVDASPESRLGTDEAKQGIVGAVEGGETGVIGRGEGTVAAVAERGARD